MEAERSSSASLDGSVRRVFTWAAVEGRSLSASIRAAPPSMPSRPTNASASHRGWLVRMDRVSSSSLPLTSGASSRSSARSTPFTRPAARGLRQCCLARFTASFTAALGGILSKNSS